MRGRNLPGNWGYVRPDYKFRESSPLYTVASFLSEATNFYVDFNLKYRKEIMANDFPFFSGEFQNQAIFFKSMSDVCKIDCLPFPEHPYEYRHRQANTEKHRLDYWVLLKKRNHKDTVLLVEYKHSSTNLRQKQSHAKKGNCCEHFANTAGLEGGWWENHDRLKNLEKKLKQNQKLMGDMARWDGRDRDIVLVNLVTSPVMITSKTEEKVRATTVSKEELDDWKNELTTILDPKPNWKVFWWLGKGVGEESQDVDYWEEQRVKYYYKYFGAYFFAYLKRIHVVPDPAKLY